VNLAILVTAANVPERDVAKLRLGNQATVQMDAFGDQQFHGRVARIAPVLDAATRSALVEVEIPNTDGGLKGEMFARVTLDLASTRQAVLIPREALVYRGSQPGVYVVQNNRPVFRTIETGLTRGEDVEVANNLEADTTIVTRRATMITEGDQIRIAAPKASQGHAGMPVLLAVAKVLWIEASRRPGVYPLSVSNTGVTGTGRNACVTCVTAALLLLALAACSRNPQPAAGTASAASPARGIPIQAATVTIRSAQRLLEVTGTLQPFDKVTVSSEVDGPTRRVLVDLGDKVIKGQLLAEVDPAEFQFQVAQAEARLRQILAALGIQEGQDPRSIRVEDTPEMRRADAMLEESQHNHRRVNQLFKEDIGTAQSVDQAQAQLKSAQANLAMTRENIATQQAQIEQFKAALDLARKKLKDTSILAPFGGSIAERQVSVGLYVRTQTPLFTIVQTNPLRLRLDVSERLSGMVRAGQPVELRVDGLAGRAFQAQVWRVSPSVNEQSRTLLVEALLHNDDEALRPGMFARATIQSGQIVKALMIPASAVLNFYGVNKVFSIDAGKVQDRTVKLGDRYGEFFEVVEGVREQEVVAITSLEKLSAGAAVEVRP